MRARSLKRLAPLLLAALAQSACTSAREQQLPGSYVDDAAITTVIKAELVQARLPSAEDIEVRTLHGTVLLSGWVPSDSDKRQAERLARNAPHVREVRNRLEVRAQE